jgi:hypothetical protein
MTHHDIKITFDGTNAKPDPIPQMTVGDTVQYFSNEGEVLIVFSKISPFRTDNETGTFVQGGRTLALRQTTPNAVPCRCFVRPAGQTEFVGWKADPSPSGGNHVVK